MRALILLAIACLAQMAVVSESKKVVCYFGSWSVYRSKGGKFAIENIEPSLCTHLIYAFVGIENNQVKVLDPWQDLADNYGKAGFRRFNELREKNPALKTLVAIGGWNEGSEKYSRMASDPTSRSTFIQSVIAFLKKHSFNGFDLDWEYPAQRGGSANDVANFVALIREMREAFDEEDFLLSAAVAAAQSSASQSYDIPKLSQYLDFINLMTYDLHGSWERQTGLHTALHPGSSDTIASRQLTVDAAVQYWLAQGVDRNKLILGIAAYGRSFTLADADENSINSETSGPGAAGRYTPGESGFLGYNEICERQKTEEWTVVTDPDRHSSYAYSGDLWVGYDDPQSVKEKAEYIDRIGLGGAMMWSIETDDFRGECGEAYPLLKALNRVLRSEVKVDNLPTNSPVTTTDRPEHNDGNDLIIDLNKVPDTSESDPEPTMSSPENSVECVEVGNMADPTNCRQFFQCVSRDDGTFVKYVQPCPTNLCYRAEIDGCDWPRH